MTKFFTLLAAVALTLGAVAQQQLPSANIKDLEGSSINIKDLHEAGKPMVVSFWATWCSPCKRELNAYQEYYEDWQDETGVKIVAVSIDDQRSVGRVGPYVNSVGWDFEVVLDTNQDLKRSLNVINVPHTFLIDGDGNIVWQHNNYSDGDEDELHEQLLKLVE